MNIQKLYKYSTKTHVPLVLQRLTARYFVSLGDQQQTCNADEQIYLL